MAKTDSPLSELAFVEKAISGRLRHYVLDLPSSLGPVLCFHLRFSLYVYPIRMPGVLVTGAR
jgi:hypothetical protein